DSTSQFLYHNHKGLAYHKLFENSDQSIISKYYEEELEEEIDEDHSQENDQFDSSNYGTFASINSRFFKSVHLISFKSCLHNLWQTEDHNKFALPIFIFVRNLRF
ncbi:MAG: hypothetical protein KBA06_05210, partial [Saprospiraceae bacterium]|nr:hypothetical protein [Saprospiraceae bacterium]